MSNVSAGFHVGNLADDPDAALRQVFEVRENQQDGLGTILKYCQDKSGYIPGNIDPSGLTQVLNNEFYFVLKQEPDPTSFVQFMNNSTPPWTVRDMIDHLPENTRLLQFMNNLPSGNYDRSIIQFITEVENGFLSLYIVVVAMQRSNDEAKSKVAVWSYFIDRDGMANRADDLVAMLREKERIEDWAKGISSEGYK
ncbi:hypothetical protein BGW41_003478 [Actinomortierella wolfii]|nr:hypothetical protein BGW41_003478 [Actinomortierella wolfii]